MQLLYLDPRTLEADPQGVREHPGDVDGLATTIAEHGLLQPLGVVAAGNGRYRVVYGNRRRAAAVQLGLERVPCILLDAEDPREASDLGHVRADEREVVVGIEVADLADTVDAFRVSDPAAQCVPGICGIGDQGIVVQHVHDGSDGSRLRVDGVDVEIPGHSLKGRQPGERREKALGAR